MPPPGTRIFQSPGRGHAGVPVGVIGSVLGLFFAVCCSLLYEWGWALWGAGRFLSPSHRHAMPSRRDGERRRGGALGEAPDWRSVVI